MAKSNLDALIEEYDYEISESFIAQNPANPRDSAKLLVYDRKKDTTLVDTYKNLVKYLPQDAVLVFNDTKVIPARIIAAKPTGGKVALLFIRKSKEELIFLANVKLEAGIVLTAGKHTLHVLKKTDSEYAVKPSFPIENYLDVLHEIGITPLPPYIKHTSLSETSLREKYQTVFAQDAGSVAAPTASLHFTQSLISEIQKTGHEIYFVTLHVNLGTFAKLTEDHVVNKRLHEEFFEIDTETAQKLNEAKKQGKTIIAVGTTVVRTLESAANSKGMLVKLVGTTDLFIQEQTKLHFTDSVITNFHVPKSSLLMLVAALVGRKKLFELYNFAIKNNFRFFSFGDGMYIK